MGTQTIKDFYPPFPYKNKYFHCGKIYSYKMVYSLMFKWNLAYAMVTRKFDLLNDYLGFEVAEKAEVPVSTGKAKVVRKKAAGDWRNWFVDEDVSLFKPAFIPYMQVVGYDCDDWNLSPEPVIEPRFSSEYMQSLPRNAKKNTIMRFIDNISQSFFKRS
jgi:hypothetical protein